MGSTSKNSSRSMFSSSHHHHAPLCTRFHQIGALALIATTFFLTRLLDHPRSSSFSSSPSSRLTLVRDDDGRFPLSWPDRGYGSQLSLKIYVYEEREIDGLTELMRGRDGRISPDSCAKGQWGTQVRIETTILGLGFLFFSVRFEAFPLLLLVQLSEDIPAFS